MRSIKFRGFALVILALSLAVGYRPDDWSRFDHQVVRVDSVQSDGTLRITTADNHRDTIRLLGIQLANGAAAWLTDHAAGRQIILLLEPPQTRDAIGRLRAFAYLDDQNLSVDLARAGFAFTDHREKTEMDGLIKPAEAEARKKKLGIWATSTWHGPPAHGARTAAHSVSSKD